MFGQNNSDPNQQDAGAQNPMLQNSAPPAGFFGQPPAQATDPGALPGSPAPGQDIMPPQTEQSAPMIMDDNPTDFGSPSTPEDMAAAAPASDPFNTPVTSSEPVSNDQLLSMKQEALQQLTPLVNHLDQSPEEKFRTVMMMIQASDDHTKLNEAFEAAKAIPDDKYRAQALLDVINEINYFTQHQN